MLPDSRVLVDDLLTLLSKSRCLKLPLPCTPCYCHERPILVLSQPALSLWCSASAVTYEKHYVFSTSLVVQVCKLACLLDVTLETVQKSWPPASGFVWF